MSKEIEEFFTFIHFSYSISCSKCHCTSTVFQYVCLIAYADLYAVAAKPSQPTAAATTTNHLKSDGDEDRVVEVKKASKLNTEKSIKYEDII